MQIGCYRFYELTLWYRSRNSFVCRHENIIAILDIVRPETYETFNEVYLIQVSLSTLS